MYSPKWRFKHPDFQLNLVKRALEKMNAGILFDKNFYLSRFVRLLMIS